MKLDYVRNLASRVFNVGKNRIKFIDEAKAKESLTREDIKLLLKNGSIEIKKKRGTSRVRARILHAKMKKGRGRGTGTRKGGLFGTTTRKEFWIMRVRAQRKTLMALRDKQALDNPSYRTIYRMIKGSAFRNKAVMVEYMKEKGMLKGEVKLE